MPYSKRKSHSIPQYPLQKKGALGLETSHYWKTLVIIPWFLNVTDLKQ